jgi:hypothetical protein
MAPSKKSDLLIRGADGKLYYITDKELQQYAVDENSPLAAQLVDEHEIIATFDVVPGDASPAPEAAGKRTLAAGLFVTARAKAPKTAVKAGLFVTYMNVGLFVTARKKKK